MSNLTRAQQAHDSLVRALATLESAQQNAVLAFAEVLDAKHYRALSYSSIEHYAREALHFSHAKTMQFVRLARDLKRLPVLEHAVANGEVSWTKARTVGAVATPENQTVWVEKARTQSRRQLETDAARVKQRARRRAKAARTGQRPLLAHAQTPDLPAGDPPRRVSFELSATQAAQLEKLLERAQRKGHRDRAATLLAALETFIFQPDTRVSGSAKTLLVAYRCDACQSTTVPSTGSDLRIPEPEAEAMSCDTEVLHSDGSSTRTIPAKTRRAVMVRDRHRCRRCRNTAFLDVHHLQRRTDGGTHDLNNCVVLCRACHVLWHEREQQLAHRKTPERLRAARAFARLE